MQKDWVSGHLPREVLSELQGEPQGMVWVRFTVCFSAGGKAAHVLDEGEGKQICGENL